MLAWLLRIPPPHTGIMVEIVGKGKGKKKRKQKTEDGGQITDKANDEYRTRNIE